MYSAQHKPSRKARLHYLVKKRHMPITLCYASLLAYSIGVIQMYSAQHKPSRKARLHYLVKKGRNKR
ncbi:hypothetical protein DWW82_02480 [Clostridium sp. AF17-2]|nr:hypothetical protein DWW85_02540 [Clostridium sp. AF17-21AC]RHR60289.1 hypothetical protein DWW82_02480 [Clostridium sp. AF17-2]